MLDEVFIRAFHLSSKTVQIPLQEITAFSQSRIKMRMRSMPMAELVGPLPSDRHLDALDGIQDQQPQLTVKDVQIEHVRESYASPELVAGVVGFEREPVCTEAVIVEMLEYRIRLARGRR